MHVCESWNPQQCKPVHSPVKAHIATHRFNCFPFPSLTYMRKLHSKQPPNLLMKTWAPPVILCFFLAFLVYFLMPTVNLDDAKIRRTQHTIRGIQTALEQFKKDTGRYPSSQEGLHVLIKEPAASIPNWHGPYGAKIETDVWGHSFTYIQPGLHGKPYTIVSPGPDEAPGTNDDIISE